MRSTDWDRMAPRYDQLNQGLRIPDIDALRDLISGQTLLELGAGTGEVAIPLAQGGLTVFALDYSEGMLDLLKAKAAQTDISEVDLIPVLADMTEYTVSDLVDEILCVNNSLLFVTSPAGQQRVFERSFENLRPGGFLTIQVNSPAVMLHVWGSGATIKPVQINSAGMLSMSAIIDANSQIGKFTYDYRSTVSDSESFATTTELRYIGENELVLMAKLAGFRLHSSMSAWDGSPLGAGPDLILRFVKDGS